MKITRSECNGCQENYQPVGRHRSSGYEHGMADYLEQNCPWADEIRRDKLGNLIMVKRARPAAEQPSRPKVMLAAHMDEIGLIVTKIEDEGFLRFSAVGGIDQRVLLAQEVIVHGKAELPGVIASRPCTGSRNETSVPMEDLYIDVGYDSGTWLIWSTSGTWRRSTAKW